MPTIRANSPDFCQRTGEIVGWAMPTKTTLRWAMPTLRKSQSPITYSTVAELNFIVSHKTMFGVVVGKG